MYDLYQEESLEHFGIKGMKWGIRRTPEQLGHKTAKKQKKQRTPEEQAKRDELKRKAVKVAKVGAAVATIGATTALAVSALSTGHPAGAVTLGSQAISQLMDSGMVSNKTMASLVKANLDANGKESISMSMWNSPKNPYYKQTGMTQDQKDLMLKVLQYQYGMGR